MSWETKDQYLGAVRASVGSTMFGLEDVTELVLIALFARGHVLLEGNPGTGKTMLVRAICSSLGFGDDRVGRIQFTPDLMPSDITGTMLPKDGDPSHFEFQPGPIFRWLLLADEINRATPKTQSALLEAMAERQVTVLNETHPLCESITVERRGELVETKNPFMVLATQNPIEQEGTYELPEAQADRFMFKILMPDAKRDDLLRILCKDAGVGAASKGTRTGETGTDAPAQPEQAARQSEGLFWYEGLCEQIRSVRPAPVVEDHILNLVQASRREAHLLPRTVDRAKLKSLVERYFVFGLGPRTGTALMLGAKGWALLRPGSSEHTAPGLGRVALACLRHRIRLDLDWEEQALEDFPVGHLTTAERRDRVLAEFVMAAAPDDSNYQASLRSQLPLDVPSRPR